MQFQPVPARGIRGLIWLLVGVLLVSAAVPLWLSIMTTWGSRSLRYELTPTTLIIHFGPSPQHVDRASILTVDLVEAPTKGARLFGTAVPGLLQGRFRYAETGVITMYATTSRPLMVVETAERKWGLSPAEPERFREALVTGQTGSFQPIRDPNRSGVSWVLIMTIPLSLGLAALSVYMLRLPGRLRYELGDEALLIHGGLRPVRVPYGSIQEVEPLATPKGSPFRIMGVGMPGLYMGSFSWKAVGRNVKLYTTQLRPITLIRAGTTTYGLSPEDVERFVEELKRRMGS